MDQSFEREPRPNSGRTTIKSSARRLPRKQRPPRKPQLQPRRRQRKKRQKKRPRKQPRKSSDRSQLRRRVVGDSPHVLDIQTMGRRVFRKADFYLRRGNRKRLGRLLRKHRYLLDSQNSELVFLALWRRQGMGSCPGSWPKAFIQIAKWVPVITHP